MSKLTDELLAIELENGTGIRAIARKYGICHSSVQKRRDRMIRNGYDQATGQYRVNTAGQILKGTSDLYRFPESDPLGRIIGWVKTNRSLTDQLGEAKAVVEAFAQDLPRLEPISATDHQYDASKLSVIPIGDPHIGLMTWAKEVGHDWDLKIAQRVFKKIFTRLLERAPNTEECILVNTGDFFHADNINGMTSRSGHVLDMDGRHGKWLDVGVVIVRMFIEMCLHKYKKVTFVNVPGNHDDILGAAIGVFSDHMYEKEPRLTVLRGNSPFQYVHRGEVLLGFAHGHTCKLPSLPGKMADDQYKLWGKSTFRHWITGHVHHNQWVQYKEHPGCSVESVGIVAPKDAYAFGGGYGGRRSLQCIVFDTANGDEYTRYREKVLATD